ncbi:hypothetical protein [Priestia megaterium]
MDRNTQFTMIRQALENSYHLMEQGIEVSGETLTQLEQAKAEYEAAFLLSQSTDSKFRCN